MFCVYFTYFQWPQETVLNDGQCRVYGKLDKVSTSALYLSCIRQINWASTLGGNTLSAIDGPVLRNCLFAKGTGIWKVER